MLRGSAKDLFLPEFGSDEYVHLARKDGRVMEVRKNCPGWEKQVERLMGAIRGKEISVIFQNPRSSLNPFIPIGKQITEAILLKGRIKNRREAKQLGGLDLAHLSRNGLFVIRFGSAQRPGPPALRPGLHAGLRRRLDGEVRREP